MKHVTIRDIARACGLSGATVSLALRDHPRIPVETRRRVKQTADDLGYRPNPMMAAHWAAVRSRKPADFHSVIAILNDWHPPSEWSNSAYNKPIFETMRQRAGELGFLLEEFSLGGDFTPGSAEHASRLRAVAKVMKHRGIHGVLCLSPAHPMEIVKAAADFEDFALVFVSSEYLNLNQPMRGMRHIPFHQVGASAYSNMILLLDQLAALGYRRPGYWPNIWMEAFGTGGETAAAFNFHTQALPESDRIRVLWKNWNFELSMPETRACFLEWIETHQPDVVICGNFEIREWIEATGRRIPQDIGLAHIDLCAMEQGWSGIDQRHDRIASASIDLISSLITRNERGMPEFIKMMRIEGEWRAGETTAARH